MVTNHVSASKINLHYFYQMKEIITSLFERDINKLIEELMLYKNEEDHLENKRRY